MSETYVSQCSRIVQLSFKTICCVVLLGAAACGDASITDQPEIETELEPLVYAPESAGAWNVGITELSGVGPDGEASDILVWYPALADDGTAYSYLDAFTTEAKELATPDCTQTRKLLIYSHGNGGLKVQAPFLTEHMASHGFVVVGIDHRENTITNFVEEALGKVMYRRPVEVSMAFDSVVEQLGAVDGLLAGCIDEVDGFGVMGHSFGGYTSLVVAGTSIHPEVTSDMCDLGYTWLCDGVAQWAVENPGETSFAWSDERVWATAPMAPCGFEALAGGLQNITVPTLVLGGGLDSSCPIDHQIEAIYSKLETSKRYLGVLPEGGHQAFSSVCEFGLDYRDCAPPYGNREMLHNRIRATVLSFFASVAGDERYLPWLSEIPGEMEWTQSLGE